MVKSSKQFDRYIEKLEITRAGTESRKILAFNRTIPVHTQFDLQTQRAFTSHQVCF